MVEHGVTVMVTTHFLDEAEYCDRIGLVYQGQIIAEGSPDELKDAVRRDERPEPTLEDAFIELVEAFDRPAGGVMSTVVTGRGCLASARRGLVRKETLQIRRDPSSS